MNEKDIIAEIKRLQSKINGNAQEDDETIQQILQLRIILNEKKDNKKANN